MTLDAIFVILIAQSSMAPPKPPFVGTEYELNDKALGEEISRTEQTRQFSPRQIEEELARQAKCLVERRGDQVAAVLGGPGSDRSNSARTRSLFGDSACTRSDFVLNYDASAFRNALSAARYQAAFPRPPVAEVDAVRLRATLAEDETTGGDGKEVTLRQLGFCTLQFGPDKAHAFVMAPLRSPEEKEALAALTPAVGQCLPPDEKVEMSRTIMRGMLAAALTAYRADGSHTADANAGSPR